MAAVGCHIGRRTRFERADLLQMLHAIFWRSCFDMVLTIISGSYLISCQLRGIEYRKCEVRFQASDWFRALKLES